MAQKFISIDMTDSESNQKRPHTEGGLLINLHRIMIEFIGHYSRRFLILGAFSLLLPLVAWIYLSVIPAATQKPLPILDRTYSTADSISGKLKHPKESSALLDSLLLTELDASKLRNRMQLADDDSIYLVLNLADSSLCLEIKGLKVRKAKAVQMQLSKRILAAGNDALLNWTSNPFTLQYELSSIPKSPILVVEAPKDTAAAATLPQKRLEPEKSAVSFTLLFDRSLVLEVNQLERPKPEDEAALALYQKAFDSTFRRSIKSRILQPYTPDAPIHIKMLLPAADARAIYRAFPHIGNAKLVLEVK